MRWRRGVADQVAQDGSCAQGRRFLLLVVGVVELVDDPFPAERVGYRFAGPGFEWLVGVDGPVTGVDEGGAGVPEDGEGREPGGPASRVLTNGTMTIGVCDPIAPQRALSA